MDIDPLAETVPPRHAIESDEEEDENNPLRVSKQTDTKVEVKLVGDVKPAAKLCIASCDAGRYWARGANLGEQSGAVMVNGVQIGLVFSPKWTESIVIISEALSRLPLYAMYPYAKTILDSLTPQSLALLDTYPVPTYITNAPKPFYQAPLRYLSTSDKSIFENKQAELFAPPNLIQSTSAAFLSIANISNITGTLILLPSCHVPSPLPKEILPSNFSQLDKDDTEWSAQLINDAQTLLFCALGEVVTQPWQNLDKEKSQKIPKPKTEIGEGGMYI